MKRSVKVNLLVVLIGVFLVVAVPQVWREGSFRYHCWRFEDRELAAEKRRASLRWLAENRPRAFMVRVLWEHPEELVTLTGEYPRVASAETPSPMRLCLGPEDAEVSEDFLTLLHDQCAAHTGTASRVGALIALRVRAQGQDPALCFVENLRHNSEPGCRNIAYLWLTHQAGFPRGFDWRAPSFGELSARPHPERERLLKDPGLKKREAMIERWRESYGNSPERGPR